MNIMESVFPVLAILIGAEYLLNLALRKRYYRVNTFIADVSNGVIFMMAGIVILAGALFVYAYIEKHWSLSAMGLSLFAMENPFVKAAGFPGFSIKPHAFISWCIALVLVDFIYYWFHRATHEISILWACHVTHHSSEELNFSVSFRGNAFQRIFEYALYMPLAFIGLPWLMFLLCHRILKVYQFMVHTRFVGKLGFLETFMVTPSNHRVHHGTQPEYLDKNHGGIFILWDRWFGTFVEEKEEPLYGLTKPVRSFSPIWCQIHVYVEIFRTMKLARNLKDRLGLLFKKPGWKPEYLRGPEDELKTPAYTAPYVPEISRGLLAYTLVQGLIVMFLGTVVYKAVRLPDIPLAATLILSAYVLYGLVSINGALEARRWALGSEILRHGLLALGATLLRQQNIINDHALYGSFLVGALSLLWVLTLRKQFTRTGSESPAEETRTSTAL